MAYDGPKIEIPGLKSGSDLTAAGNQYKAVKLDAAGDVILCTAAGEFSIGILQNKPNTGQAAEVLAVGVSKVQADAALTEGAQIATAADGQVKAASALVQATGAASNVLGYMLTEVTAAAQIGTAMIIPGGIVPTSAA